jgi:ribosomal protein L11 methyltransferase
MPTTLARFACDAAAARRLTDRLGESLDADGTVCTAFESAPGEWQLAIHFRDPPDEAAVRALVALAAGESAADALTFETLADADWVTLSLIGLAPVSAGRFIVHGAHDRARVPVNALAIEIEAARAFGTGHHGTTRGCLLALDALAKRLKHAPIPPPKRGSVASRVGVGMKKTPPRTAFGGSTLPFQGRDNKGRVLDLGTGSGVLAIAAAKTWRKPVIASDIDPVAMAAARANARLNRVAPGITVLCAAGSKAQFIARNAPYDLIFGNILLEPLMRLAVPLACLTAPGAHIVLSGLLPSQANAVRSIYGALGLALAHRITLDGWVTLVLKRKPPRAGEPGRLRR